MSSLLVQMKLYKNCGTTGMTVIDKTLQSRRTSAHNCSLPFVQAQLMPVTKYKNALYCVSKKYHFKYTTFVKQLRETLLILITFGMHATSCKQPNYDTR